VPTARYVLYSTFCPHTVFMCFVWIWEQTAIISLYSINCLVFITEIECVYCAVRSTFYVLPTQCIYVFCEDLWTNNDFSLYSINSLVSYDWDEVCLLRGTFYILPTHCIYVFVWIWEQTAIISLYSVDWLVFITETVWVFCVVCSTFCPYSVYMCFVDLKTNSDYFTVQN
jgi:hypothetical protein